MKKFFTLIAAVAMMFAASAETLDVCMGESYASTLPIYGLWCDTENTLGQMIYPADMLEDMAGSEITGVQFYTAINAYEAYGLEPQNGEWDYVRFSGATIQLSLKVVDELGFTVEEAMVGATPVATAQPEYGDRYMTFVLDEPFAYEGGNLLVECKVTEPGSYGTNYWWVQGVDDYYPGYYEYQSYNGMVSYTVDYLPAATFTYEAATPVDPDDPHMTGNWLVVIDMFGNHNWFELQEGANGDYVTSVSLEYYTYGLYDPNYDAPVPFYFMVNGVQYGAEEAMTVANLGQAMENPLVPSEEYYTVPVGYSYALGIAIIGGEMYVYASQAYPTSVNELVNGKEIASKRYFNLAGQEMQEANGMTIVVTTYTDGTTSTAKVMK